MTWPADWPEDAKVGLKFLQELMRRYPGRAQSGTLEDGIKWLGSEPKAEPKKAHRT
jgi:hypothetical protein